MSLKVRNTTSNGVLIEDIGILISPSSVDELDDVSLIRQLCASKDFKGLIASGILVLIDSSGDVPAARAGEKLAEAFVTGGADVVLKTQTLGPIDAGRQFFSLGNGGAVYEAQPNAVNIFDMELAASDVGADQKVQLLGGEYWTNGNVEEGDYVEFSVVDKNDVLGYFAAFGLVVGQDVFELAKYVRKRPVVLNEHGQVAPGRAAELFKGLFLRTIYVASNQGAARKLRISYNLAK